MREWSAEDVRHGIETYLLSDGSRLSLEVLGTLVPDEDHLIVVVRFFDHGEDIRDQVQSMNFDLQYLYEAVPATTLDQAFGEVLSGVLHFPSEMHEVEVDASGIRHWTESNRQGRSTAP